ncbi:MAG: NAD(P)/FAD-dependent oxidoreductase [Gammaproteobacteria bacterium]|jgi:thioredoxin reductase (NADPH)|nr:NAD(P)/FAD-dependent oxidoreductase [Gammaproteobacteria bacterium]
MKIWDCVIVGGGPAGLTAAIYLSRFRRRVLVLHSNKSRARLIPTSHNYPGFPEGISGIKLLDKLGEQAKLYGAEIIEAVVSKIQKSEFFEIQAESKNYHAHCVILATGLEDIEPPLPNCEAAIAKGLVRHCPVCDGFEVQGQKIAVIGQGEKVLKEALFMKTYSDDVTVLSLGKRLNLNAKQLKKAQENNIRIVEAPIQKALVKDNKISAFCFGKWQLEFDTVYSALGAKLSLDIVKDFKLSCNDQGCLFVDEHQQTSVEGLYAAGDIVSSLNQICVATGQAAIASSAIHKKLSS